MHRLHGRIGRRALWVRAVLPAAAHRLHQALSGTGVETHELITEAQFSAMTDLIARGTRPKDAVRSTGVPLWLLKRFLKANADLRQRWKIARIVARHRWCPLEEVLADISNTDLSLQQICARRGVNYSRFLRLSHDPYIAEQYLAAKETQRLRLDDANESAVSAALDGAANRKSLRQAMRAFNKTATRIRGLRPRRIRARIKRAVCDPAARLEAAAVARCRAAKARRTAPGLTS